MEILGNLALGLQTALAPQNLVYCFLGVFLGTFVGVLPGIGTLAAVSMLLPISFYLEPTAALVMLAGVYYGAEYGGSTTSILMNLPGGPSSAVTCLDGHPMAKEGRAGVALFITTIASFVGGTIGIVLLVGLAPVLGQVALSFGASEFFALMCLGLVAAAAVAQGSALKGIAMVVLGVMLGLVDTDVETGVPRFAFGIPNLYDGFNIVALAMGLFGVSEVIASIGRPNDKLLADRISLRSMFPRMDEIKRAILPTLRGTAIGSFFGILPGTGPTVSAYISYAAEKGVSRDPSKFGKGAIEGIAAPEASNNAAIQTAFIPTLTIGLPGSASMAIMLGALMIHGITPGPRLITDHPDVFWGLVASFWIGNIMLLILNIPLIGLWVRLLRTPYRLLYPAILVLICIGVYSVNGSIFDVGLVLLFGAIGYGMRLLGFEPAPLLIGFVLGPMLEENLRRAMQLARGDITRWLDRPITVTLLLATVALIAWSIWSSISHARRRREQSLAAAVADPNPTQVSHQFQERS